MQSGAEVVGEKRQLRRRPALHIRDSSSRRRLTPLPDEVATDSGQVLVMHLVVQLTNDVITIAIRLRYNYDASRMPASIRGEQKVNLSVFIVIVSQLNRTHIVISITFVVVECAVVSSYRSHIVVESQL